MKKYILIMIIMIVVGACRKEDVKLKDGPSLPEVQNLKLDNASNAQIKLSWAIPSNIPTEIERPLNVYIEVNKIIGPTKHITVNNQTIEEEVTSALLDAPKEPGEYHFVVKLNGATKLKDPNYSSNIFSLGQTVVFKK